MRWKWPCLNWARGRALALPVSAVSMTCMALASAPTATAAKPGLEIRPLRANTSVHNIAIFGADDRVALPPSLRPLREMLGILFNARQRTVCTAFCVAPNMIGTAAHCLFKTKGEKAPRLADFWFARNYDAVRDYARIAGYETGTAAQSIIAGSVKLSTIPPIDATNDWAFVRLATPVCSKGTFEITPIPVDRVIQESKAGRIYQVSYHKDFKQWQPAYSRPCRVDRSFANAPWQTIAQDFDSPEHLLLHECDTGGASSGSPLLLDTDRGPKVIGINVGTYVQSRTVVHQDRVVEQATTASIANTGVSAMAFADRLGAYRNTRIVNGALQLKEVQERLQKAGHYHGPIDGRYGPALRMAIDAYQASISLPKTGVASEELLTRLRSSTATNVAPPAKPR